MKIKKFKQKIRDLKVQKTGIVTCRGSISVQFLLGFILVLIFILLFASMTLTLIMSEVTQYITYTSSRALSLAHNSLEEQEKAAKEKYKVLRNNSVLKRLFTSTIFKINSSDDMGLGLNEEIENEAGDPNLFYGVWTEFIPKILEVDTAWGSTKGEEKEDFFKTNIGSYLGREPSKEECEQFKESRYELILRRHDENSVPRHFPDNLKFADNFC